MNTLKLLALLTACTFLALTGNAQVQKPGNALIAHYPLDGTAIDASLNQLNGIYVGNPLEVPGAVGTAMKLDGISDYIFVSHNECFNSIDTEFTISGYVKPFSIANAGDWLAFICKGDQIDLNSSPFSVLYHHSELYPYIRYVDNQHVKYVYEYAGSPGGVVLNEWTFFSWTFKKGVTKVYKNGQLIGSTDLGFTRLDKNDQPFEMGRDAPGFAELLDGVLDDICLFNRALSDAQIMDMYVNKHCYVPEPETKTVTICEGEQYHGHSTSGTYLDTVSLENNCKGLQTTELIVQPVHCCLENTSKVPNAFSPNGDGLNDTFRPLIVENSCFEVKFWIYNRWGELVFESKKPDDSWDGTSNGKKCPADVYVWVLRFNSSPNTTQSNILNGDITLIR